MHLAAKNYWDPLESKPDSDNDKERNPRGALPMDIVLFIDQTMSTKLPLSKQQLK